MDLHPCHKLVRIHDLFTVNVSSVTFVGKYSKPTRGSGARVVPFWYYNILAFFRLERLPESHSCSFVTANPES